MTAINFCFTDERAFVAADSLVSGAAPSDGMPCAAAKVIALPGLRLVVAGAGHLTLLCEWVSFLMNIALPRTYLADFDVEAPGILRLIRKRHRLTKQSTLYHFGIEADERVAVSAFCSANDFNPRRLTPGVWISPPQLEQRAAGVAHAGAAHGQHDALPPPAANPSAAWPWHDQVRTVVDTLPLQQQQAPKSIGGRIVCTTLTPDSVHQEWVRELPVLDTCAQVLPFRRRTC